MLKLKIHVDKFNKTILIVYNCPHCSHIVNSNIKSCTLCYKALPDVSLLECSIMFRGRWHVSPEDELTAALTNNYSYQKPSRVPRPNLIRPLYTGMPSWLNDIENIKSME